MSQNPAPRITIIVSGHDTVLAAGDRDARVPPLGNSARLDYGELRRSTIAMFDRLLRENKISSRDELRVLGWNLFEMVFHDHRILSFFDDELRKARRRGNRLLLELLFESSGRYLSDLPWEFLFDPRENEFMVTHVDLVLSRFMPLEGGRTSLAPDAGPLRILVAVSRPREETTVMAKPTIDVIQEVFATQEEKSDQPEEEKMAALLEQMVDKLNKSPGGRERPPDPTVVLKVLKQPTRQSLTEELKQFKPHVLHFIGHGEYRESLKKGVIALIDAAVPGEKARWHDEEEIIDCFKFARSYPRLVFLQMCKGAEARFHTTRMDFTGFGPQLIRAEVPAVVAMKYPIENQHASKFSEAFYRALAAGEGVDAAVQAGRQHLGFSSAFSSRVFGTPILYMHSADGIIMPPKQPGKEDLQGAHRPKDQPPAPAPSSPGLLPADSHAVRSVDLAPGSRPAQTFPPTARPPGAPPRASGRSPLAARGLLLDTEPVTPAAPAAGTAPQKIGDAGRTFTKALPLEAPDKFHLLRFVSEVEVELAGKTPDEMVDSLYAYHTYYLRQGPEHFTRVIEAMLQEALTLS